MSLILNGQTVRTERTGSSPRGLREQQKGHLFQGNKGQIMGGTGEQRQYWGTGNI